VTNDFSQDLAGQLEQIRTTLESVSRLQQEIQSVGKELAAAGRLSESNLQQLGEISSTATTALNNLASASGFLNELQKTSGPTVKQLTQSLYEFQRVLTQSVQDLTSGLSSLPRVLKSLESTSDAIDTKIRTHAGDLFVLIESLTKVAQSSPGDSSVVDRLYLVAPAAIVGTIFGMVLLDLAPADSVAWTALTLVLVVAGFPGKKMIADLWSKVQTRFK
jgi:ABC-type transporter Mla subunit MlaD